MVKVAGVRFKTAGKVYYFDPDDIEVKIGDSVIVETARGMEFGRSKTTHRKRKEKRKGHEIQSGKGG